MLRALTRLLTLLVLSSLLAHADYLKVDKAAPVRSQPSGDADTAFKVKSGDLLQLLDNDKTNGYYHVQDISTGETGWIFKSWVRRFAGDPPAATSHDVTVSGGAFPVNRCQPPYNEEPESGLDIESCGLTGDARKGSGEEIQNPEKNNLCGTGIAQFITPADISDLQKEVDDAEIQTGKTPPKDRTPLRNLPALSNGLKLGEGSLVSFVGFLNEAHYMPKSESKSKTKKGGESVNCHTTQHAGADIHLAFSLSAGRIGPKDPNKNAKLCKTISGEMIPHLRPAVWNTDNLSQVIDLGRPVRITGQLFFDGSHVPCNGDTPVPANPARISVWEIHPIYTFDICKFTDITKCDPRKAAPWEAISKAKDIQSDEDEVDQ